MPTLISDLKITEIPQGGEYWCVTDYADPETSESGWHYVGVNYQRVVGWEWCDYHKSFKPLVCWHRVMFEDDNQQVGRAVNNHYLLEPHELPQPFKYLKSGDRVFSTFIMLCFDQETRYCEAYYKNNELEDGDMIMIDTDCLPEPPTAEDARDWRIKFGRSQRDILQRNYVNRGKS